MNLGLHCFVYMFCESGESLLRAVLTA